MPAIPKESLRNAVLFLLESLVMKDLNFIEKANATALAKAGAFRM